MRPTGDVTVGLDGVTRVGGFRLGLDVSVVFPLGLVGDTVLQLDLGLENNAA